MPGVGLREQGWPYEENDLKPSVFPTYRDKPSPEIRDGADDKVLSLCSTNSGPETAASNEYWKSERTATPWGEGQRKQRWVRVSDGSPKSSGLPWTPQSLLQGPGHCFCGIFPPTALPAGPAAWLCLNCHPAKALVARPNCNPANTPGL